MGDKHITFTRCDFMEASSLVFCDIYQSGDFSDVTLVPKDGAALKAHKIVLSASSSVFKKLVSTSKEMVNVAISHSDLSLIVQFIYTGKCDVKLVDTTSFLISAKYLKIKGLINKTTNVPNDVTYSSSDSKHPISRIPQTHKKLNSSLIIKVLNIETDLERDVEGGVTCNPIDTNKQESNSIDPEVYNGSNLIYLHDKLLDSPEESNSHIQASETKPTSESNHQFLLTKNVVEGEKLNSLIGNISTYDTTEEKQTSNCEDVANTPIHTTKQNKTFRKNHHITT